jgi:hypothetical protein
MSWKSGMAEESGGAGSFPCAESVLPYVKGKSQAKEREWRVRGRSGLAARVGRSAVACMYMYGLLFSEMRVEKKGDAQSVPEA